MPYIRIIILSTLVLCTALLVAADLKVDAYVDNNRVGLNDALQLTIEVTGDDADQPVLPQMDGFRVGGTSSGSSTSITIVNGRMEKEIKRTYTYRLLPQRTGRLMIPPVTVRAGGQSQATKAIEVTVVEGSTQRVPVPQQRRQQQSSEPESDLVQDNLFIRAQLSKSDPYVGEPVSVTYTLYTRYDVANLSYGDEPSYTGFWKEDTYQADRMAFDTVTMDGQRYNAMKLRTVNLIPHEAGRQVIPPQEMVVDIMVQARSFFDFGSTRRMRVKSDPLVLNVKTLPATGQPSEFSGAIGRFSISSDISASQLRAGEPFTYTLTVSGEGNFDNFTLPSAPQMNHIHFMDPEVDRDVRGNSGKVTLRFPAYVEEEGSFRIPAVPFSFFDTRKQQYIVLNAPEQSLRVQPADPALTQDNPYVFDQNVADARHLASAIDHIVYTADLTTEPPAIVPDLRRQGKGLAWHSWALWTFWALLVATLPLSALLARHRRRLAGDRDYTRQRQAHKILRKYLREAEEHASKIEFYSAAQAGLANYLADKLRLPRGSTIEGLLRELRQRQAPDELADRLAAFFRRCDEARFMPGGFSPQMVTKDGEELRTLVQELTRWKETS